MYSNPDFAAYSTRVRALPNGISKSEVANDRKTALYRIFGLVAADLSLRKGWGFAWIVRVGCSWAVHHTPDFGSTELGRIGFNSGATHPWETTNPNRQAIIDGPRRIGIGEIYLGNGGTATPSCNYREIYRKHAQEAASGGCIFGPHVMSCLMTFLKIDASANGIRPELVGTHTLRAGCATCRYVMGLGIALIRRFGRWGSCSFLRYFRRAIVALGPLWRILAVSGGLLGQLQQHSAHPIPADKFSECRAGGGNYAPGWDGWIEDRSVGAEEGKGGNLKRTPLFCFSRLCVLWIQLLLVWKRGYKAKSASLDRPYLRRRRGATINEYRFRRCRGRGIFRIARDCISTHAL